MAESVYNPCDLRHIAPDTDCAEQFAGIGEQILLFKKSELQAEPTFDPAKPGYYVAAGFTFASGKGFYTCPLKQESNNIKSKSIRHRGGFKNTLTAVVENPNVDVDLLVRTLNNSDFGALVPTGNGGYYVLYNPDKRLTFSYEGDTGTKAEDEPSGNITIEVPQVFPRVRWDGTPTIAGAV